MKLKPVDEIPSYKFIINEFLKSDIKTAEVEVDDQKICDEKELRKIYNGLKQNIKRQNAEVKVFRKNSKIYIRKVPRV